MAVFEGVPSDSKRLLACAAQTRVDFDLSEVKTAVFDDIPITAIVTMETVGTGTHYVFTAPHRNEADLENNKTSGFYEGTEIAIDQFVEQVIAMK